MKLKTVTNKRETGGNSAVLDWDAAITDATTEIQRLRRRITVLEGGIEVFRERKRSGDVFPSRE